MDVHNAFRKAVVPTASNMLKMVIHSLIIHILHMHLSEILPYAEWKEFCVINRVGVMLWHSQLRAGLISVTLHMDHQAAA